MEEEKFGFLENYSLEELSEKLRFLEQRKQALEQEKQEIEEKNQFLQKNLHRLLQEKVSLLHQIEEMRHREEEIEDVKTEKIRREETDEEESRGNYEESLGNYIETKVLPRVYELEARWRGAKERAEQLFEENQRLKQRLKELQREFEFVQREKEKLERGLSRVYNLLEALIQEKILLEESHRKELRPPLRKEEVSLGLPLKEEDLSLLSLDFLSFLEEKGIFEIEPVPAPDSTLGYVYQPVREWGKIPKGEEASFLEACVKQGVLKKEFALRVHLCGYCFRYNLNFQRVCPTCHKGQYSLSKEEGRETFFCHHCRAFFQPVFLLHCLYCGKDFPLEQAISCHLYRYCRVQVT